MSYLTDRKRVSGLGSAKEGTHHFIVQRVTAIALIPLVCLFIYPLGKNIGGEYETVIATYANPFHAIVAILFFVTASFHLRLGLQVVIEDYVHGKASRPILLIANTLFCWLIGLAGVFAVAKIAL